MLVNGLISDGVTLGQAVIAHKPARVSLYLPCYASMT